MSFTNVIYDCHLRLSFTTVIYDHKIFKVQAMGVSWGCIQTVKLRVISWLSKADIILECLILLQVFSLSALPHLYQSGWELYKLLDWWNQVRGSTFDNNNNNNDDYYDDDNNNNNYHVYNDDNGSTSNCNNRTAQVSDTWRGWWWPGNWIIRLKLNQFRTTGDKNRLTFFWSKPPTVVR